MSTNIARPVETSRPRRWIGATAVGLAIAIALSVGYATSHDDVPSLGPDTAREELDQNRHAKPDGFIPDPAWSRRYEEYTKS
jgi:hypothetical protein